MAGNWKMNPATLQEAETLAALVAAAAKADGGVARAHADVLCCPPGVPGAGGEDHRGFGRRRGRAERLLRQGRRVHRRDVSQHGGVRGRDARAGGPLRAPRAVRRDGRAGGPQDARHPGRRARRRGVHRRGKEQYDGGLVRDVCGEQLAGALQNVSAEEIASGKVVIAYEPVWAIGTGLTATPARRAIRARVHPAAGREPPSATPPPTRWSSSTAARSSPTPWTSSCGARTWTGVWWEARRCRRTPFGAHLRLRRQSPGPAKLWAEEVAAVKNELGESPVWDAVSQTLHWVDAPGKTLWSWDLVHDPVKAEFGEVLGFVALRAAARCCSGSPSQASSPTTPDARQGGFVGVRAWSEHAPERRARGPLRQPGGGVVQQLVARGRARDWLGVAPMSAGTRELAEIIDYKIRCSNATCFTPDGRTMFFCDSPTRRVYCFDYDPRAGLSNRRLLYELPSDMDGSPDGAQCDADGCPWIAISGASKVIRVSRERGVVDHEIELPVKCPTSVTFGAGTWIPSSSPRAGRTKARCTRSRRRRRIARHPGGLRGRLADCALRRRRRRRGHGRGRQRHGGTRRRRGGYRGRGGKFCGDCGTKHAAPKSSAWVRRA